ncbi:MAG: hypothetical protein GXY33_15705 [Phycisphaerae bacterium]|nr:hypothetical protein [Phycisphaerae bacterium]
MAPAAGIRRCRDLPGQRLFEYIDENGDQQPIDSEDINVYLREATGSCSGGRLGSGYSHPADEEKEKARALGDPRLFAGRA